MDLISTARTTITNYAVLFLGLVNSIVLSRDLGPLGRGELQASLLLPVFITFIISLGIPGATKYFSARSEYDVDAIYWWSQILVSIFSIAGMIVGFIAIKIFLGEKSDVVRMSSQMFLLAIPLGLLSEVNVAVLQGRLHIGLFNIFRLFVPIGYLLATLLLVFLDQLTVVTAIISQLILRFLLVGGSSIAIFLYGYARIPKLKIALLRKMLDYGFKVHLGTISGIANLSLDQLLMSIMLPPLQLGLYAAAVSVSGVARAFSQAVQTLILPSMAKLDSPETRSALFQTVFRKYWTVHLAMCLFLAIVLPFLIPLLLGAEYVPSIPLTEVLLIAVLFGGVKDVLSAVAQGTGLPIIASRAEAFSLIVTVCLLLILLPTWGAMGAAIATVGAYLSGLVILIIGLRGFFGSSIIALFVPTTQIIGMANHSVQLLRNARRTQ